MSKERRAGVGKSLSPELEEKLRNIDLDPNRTFLEQFEELAVADDDILEWLEKEIYPNRELMRELDPMMSMIIGYT